MTTISRYFLPLIFSTLFWSCSEEKHIDQHKLPTYSKAYEVTADRIEQLVSAVRSEKAVQNGTPLSDTPAEIQEITDKNGTPLLYIAHYDDKRFMIFSSDVRAKPVLAYSDENSFDDGTKELPPALEEWLEAAKDYAREIKTSTTPLTEAMTEAWQPQQIQRSISPKPVTRGDCEVQFEVVQPLIKTNWGQGLTYNELVPLSGCRQSDNGRAPTGCVATAMAQIMKYHQYPPTYQWDSMPNNMGSFETSRLMRDIGIAVEMDYDCKASATKTKKVAPAAFKENFGYADAHYAEYNFQIVRKQLQARKPVILCGGKSATLLGIYKEGHAWVCDGYKSLTFSPHCWWLNRDFSYTLLHMNWGWGGTKYNGWFDHRFWDVRNQGYNFKRGVVYNITP